jgi:hypothetical protein
MLCCMNCGELQVEAVDLISEQLYVCKSCGYGRGSLREPIQYDDEYESKYLSYDEKSICDIRMNFVHTAYRTSNLKNTRRKLLDYGCGSGAFVRAARANCLVAYGFDVCDYTADLRPPQGFEPDIITAWDSFEHLTDEQQRAFFKRAKSAKIIIVSVPDFFTPVKDVSIKEWRHYRPREHLHYYTLKALCVQFEQEGFSAWLTSHDEDKIRKAPWNNNILTVGFVRKDMHHA